MDEKLIRIKRELRDLKTYHAKRSLMQASYYAYRTSLPSPYHLTAVRVTYASGTQPILTEFYAGNGQDWIPFAPNGNTQDFVYSTLEGYADVYQDQPFFIISTRQITNIQQVSV
mgnify:CR=1 FL=1